MHKTICLHLMRGPQKNKCVCLQKEEVGKMWKICRWKWVTGRRMGGIKGKGYKVKLSGTAYIIYVTEAVFPSLTRYPNWYLMVFVLEHMFVPILRLLFTSEWLRLAFSLSVVNILIREFGRPQLILGLFWCGSSLFWFRRQIGKPWLEMLAGSIR